MMKPWWSRLVRILSVFLFAVVVAPSLAHASSPPYEADAPALRVAAAVFTPTSTDDGIDWSALWVLARGDELDVGERGLVRFAVPLEEGATLDNSPHTALIENGRVAGIVVVGEATPDGRVVRAVVHQRLGRDVRSAVRLAAPIAAGTAVQIIDGDVGGGSRLEIETGSLLERRIGYVAPRGVSDAAREEARRLTAYRASKLRGAAIYLRGDDVRSMSGISGTLVTSRARGHVATIGVAVVFALLVAVLLVAVRKLRHSASVERADAVLAAELDALGPSLSDPPLIEARAGGDVTPMTSLS